MCGLEICATEKDRLEQFTTASPSNEELSLLSIFENMDSPVYVATMDTYKILYTNKALDELLGMDVTGLTCHEALQGESEPCLFCTNDKIKELGDVYIWEFCRKSGRWYKCVDKAITWYDGSLVRLEIAVDITDMKIKELELNSTVDNLKEAISIITRGI